MLKLQNLAKIKDITSKLTGILSW